MEASNANGQYPFLRGNLSPGRDSALPEGSFLSPADSAGVLASLEEQDERTLGMAGGRPFDVSLEDEGVFVSPEEALADEPPPAARAARLPREPGAGPGPGAPVPAPAERQKAASLASESSAAAGPGTASQQSAAREGELLSRIAGELRSIKSELAGLKDHYRDMLSDSAAFIQPAEAMPRPDETEPEPAPKGQLIPEEMFSETRALLGYLDGLLESLPDGKIEEFARSEYYDLYRKVYEFFNPV